MPNAPTRSRDESHHGRRSRSLRGGRTRAESLATSLKDADITAIYTTEFKRTQQTAAPLAKALGIAVTVIPSKSTADPEASRGTGQRAGGRPLELCAGGHRPLGVSMPVKITDDDFDNLFIVDRGSVAARRRHSSASLPVSHWARTTTTRTMTRSSVARTRWAGAAGHGGRSYSCRSSGRRTVADRATVSARELGAHLGRRTRLAAAPPLIEEVELVKRLDVGASTRHFRSSRSGNRSRAGRFTTCG